MGDSVKTAVHKGSRFKMAILAITIAILCLGILLVVGFDNNLKVTHYHIESPKLNKAIRAVVLTDLHSQLHGENQEALLATIDAQNPDLILMAGDIADDRRSHEGTLLLLEGIARKYPCFYVSGNHEFWSGEVDEIKAFFRQSGVQVLEGDKVTVEVSDQTVTICGVDDPEIGEAVFEEQLEAALAEVDTSKFTILLSHRPERLEQISAYASDLVISGHAHGGQVRIPFLDIGLYSPNQGVFPRYTNGMYALGDSKMLVSRGLSREIYVLPRLFNPPELVVLDVSP